MPAGVAAPLRKVQLGVESAWGTAVAATALVGGITDVKVRVMDELVHVEDLGRIGPGAQVLQQRQWAEVTIEQILSYEDAMYLFHGLFGTPTTTGSSDPYTHAYAAPLTAVPTAKFFTGELGAASNAYKAAGLIIRRVRITGEAGGIWKATWDCLAKSAATVSLAALSDRAYEGIRMADTVLSVDAAGGTMGSTAAPATLISFDVDIDTGRHLKWFAGSLLPLDYGEGRWSAVLKTVLEFNATAKAYIDALIGPAKVQRQIELEATSGSHVATLQVAGVADGGVELWGNRDGNLTVEYTWKAYYNSTFGNYLKAALLNAVAALV